MTSKNFSFLIRRFSLIFDLPFLIDLMIKRFGNCKMLMANAWSMASGQWLVENSRGIV